MKHSLAKELPRRILLLLLAALAVLFIGSFLLVSRVIHNQYRQHDRAIVSIYSDLVVHIADLEDVPVDQEHAELLIYYGSYICSWYNIDYAYMYVPDTENDTITYLAVSYNTEHQLDSNMVGRTVDRALTPEELAVWNEEEFFGEFRTNDELGHELSTVLLARDEMGNKMLAAVNTNYASVFWKVARIFGLAALGIAAVFVGVYFIITTLVRRRVSQPARQVSQAMQDFISDGQRSHLQLDTGGDDEFSMIAGAFNSMTQEIDSYLSNIHALTQAQERQNAELDIAGRIQQGFLPPTRYTGPHCRISACMLPAKNVGGDLYDYLALDEYRTAVLVADVSGKGMAAALFMAVTLMLMRQFAKLGLSPAEILQKTNDTLSENNPRLLFATAFLGIYDSRDRSFTYANAGHNLPYALGRELRTLDGGTGLLLGLYPGEVYPQSRVTLAPGDTLFLYTDGVNEATNAQKQFFGIERLVQAMQEFSSSDAADLTAFLQERLQKFAGETEPHDDVTILTLTAADTTELTLRASPEELPRLRQAILDLPLPRQDLLALCLAAEECFVNICTYAYPPETAPHETVDFTLTYTDRVEMCFADHGQPYDPLDGLTAPEDYDLDTQMGGLGQFLAMSVTNDARYVYRDGKNVLTLIKEIEEEPL